MTTREIVTILAERVGRESDLPFLQELRVIVNGWRSTLLYQTLSNNPKDRRLFLDHFSMEMIAVDPSECAELGLCEKMRTKFKVPNPVRANSMLFEFVGSPEFTTPFGEGADWQLKFFKESEYTGHEIRYTFKSGYIYITDNETTRIGIIGVIEDKRALSEVQACTGECPEEDMDFMISDEIGNRIIRSVLATELRVQGNDEMTIKPEITNGSAQ